MGRYPRSRLTCTSVSNVCDRFGRVKGAEDVGAFAHGYGKFMYNA
jgi:hypothetical protein